MTHESLARHKIGFIGGKYLPFHQGHVYTIIEAANQVEELYVIVSSSKNRDKELCDRDGIKYMPADLRLSWVGQAVRNLDNVTVIHVEDDQWDADYNWEKGAAEIKKAIGKPIDAVFSSEPDYDVHFKKYYPGAAHIVVDDKRKTVTISATELRRNLFSHWEKLPKSVQAYFAKKIAIVGTESVGKSTLTKQLAAFYNTNFVHEVGRDYCERSKNMLTRQDFDKIAMEHYLLQAEKATECNRCLFIDSDAVITQYYLEMYTAGSLSGLIEEVVKLQEFDMMLYLEPDVPWIADGFRFQGSDVQRDANNQKLKSMYAHRGLQPVTVSGNYKERFGIARKHVDALFDENPR